jgi:hypothetical protein
MPFWADGYNASSGVPVGNVSCNQWSANRDYFSHAHLSIFRNGVQLAIPQYIGWSDACIYDINTDSRNGVIDTVSSTGYKFMTLGQFFTIWGQSLSRDNIAGITGLPVVIYLEDNGALSVYTGDPATIELATFRSITIQLGTRLDEIPVYDWSSYSGSGN